MVLVRATGLWFSLSLFGSSHKSIDVPKLVLTANGFIKSPPLTFHPPPAHPWSLKVNVKFQNYAAKCSQALNRLKTLNSHGNRPRRWHRQLGNSNMQMSAKYIRTIYRRAPLSPCTNLYREQKSKAKQGSNDGDKARLLISKPEIQKARITNALRVPKKSWPRELDEHTKKKEPSAKRRTS